MTSPDLVSYAAIAPDGRALSYITMNLNIVELRTGSAVAERAAGLSGLVWSQDGSQLAIGGGVAGIYVTSRSGTQMHQIPTKSGDNVSGVHGWLDASHLVVDSFDGHSFYTDPSGNKFAMSTSIGSLDINTGNLRIIATIQSPGLAGYRWSVSPDGKTALLSNAPFRANPLTPLADEVDLATGQITSLPTIATLSAVGLSSVAWQSGTETLAVSTGYLQNDDLKTWLLDLPRDTATQLPVAGYPGGWAPDTNTFVMTNSTDSAIGTGPFDLTAVTVGANGQSSAITLTQRAMSFAYVGLVRTA
jgi:hypothetical protein